MEPPNDADLLPPLIDRVSFLVHRINAHLLRVTNPLLRKWRIDLIESRLLAVLFERGPLSAGEIVAIMALPQSTVSHQTKRLEKIGYVSRASGKQDSRMVITALTELGREIASEGSEISRTVTDQIREAIGDGELELVRASLKRVDAMLAPQGR